MSITTNVTRYKSYNATNGYWNAWDANNFRLGRQSSTSYHSCVMKISISGSSSDFPVKVTGLKLCVNGPAIASGYYGSVPVNLHVYRNQSDIDKVISRAPAKAPYFNTSNDTRIGCKDTVNFATSTTKQYTINNTGTSSYNSSHPHYGCKYNFFESFVLTGNTDLYVLCESQWRENGCMNPNNSNESYPSSATLLYEAYSAAFPVEEPSITSGYERNGTRYQSLESALSLRFYTPSEDTGADDFLIEAYVNNSLKKSLGHTSLVISSPAVIIPGQPNRQIVNCAYNSEKLKANLKEGDAVYFKIYNVKGTGSISEAVKTSTVIINTKPKAPHVDGKNTTSYSTLPVVGGKVSVTLNSDDATAERSISFKVGISDSPILIPPPSNNVVSGYEIYETGCYWFFAYDGCDISLPTLKVVTRNTLPVLKDDYSFVSSKWLYPNDTISIENISFSENSGKLIHAVKVQYRAATTLEELNSVAYSDMTISNYDKESICTFGPYNMMNNVTAGQYYQLRFAASDGLDYSSYITLSPLRMAGSLTVNTIPYIKNTDTLPVQYVSYYKNQEIEISGTLPEIPDGYKNVYYKFEYSFNNGQTYEFATELNSSLVFIGTVKNNNVISNSFNHKVKIPLCAQNEHLICRVYFYTDDNSQGRYSQNSNILYPILPPYWSGQNYLSITYVDTFDNIMKSDQRFCIRPNLLEFKDDPTTSAFNGSIPIPHSIFSNDELQYQIEIGNRVIREYKQISGSTSDNLNININDITYKDLEDNSIYNLCETSEEARVGPYALPILIKIRDISGYEISSYTTNLTIDFREKPKNNFSIELYSDGVLLASSDPAKLNYIGKNKIKVDNGFVKAPKIALSGEHLLVVFDTEEIKSYPAQLLSQYDVYLNKSDDSSWERKFTFYESDLSSCYVNYDNSKSITSVCLRIPTTSLFDVAANYYVRIVVYDKQIYSSNNSGLSNQSNNIIGLSQPELELKLSDSIIFNFEKPPQIINFPNNWVDYNKNTSWKNYELEAIFRESILYSPQIQISLLGSIAPNFKENNVDNLLFDYRYNVSSTDYNLNLSSFSYQFDSTTTHIKYYIQAIIKYSIGLKYDDSTGQIIQADQICYSNIGVYTGQIPTVSYRQNGVGINATSEVLTSDTIFCAQSYGTKNKIIFMGNKNDSPAQTNGIKIDLGEGVIEKFNDSDILIPVLWCALDSAIAEIKNLTFSENYDIINI